MKDKGQGMSAGEDTLAAASELAKHERAVLRVVIWHC